MLSVLASCKTYYIPVDSFKEQFASIDSTDLVLVRTRGPMGDIALYEANPFDFIQCLDKAGNAVELRNGPSIETRFTTSGGKRTILYFDRIFLEEGIIYGYRSRFLGYPTEIRFSDVTLIEVQNGKKNFKYVK